MSSNCEDEIARLTALCESMQEDAVQNTATIKLLIAEVDELAEENRGLRQMMNMEKK